jgi:23S rRNA pseudouridine2605 synthase
VEIDGQRCAFKSIEDGGGEGANHWYRCVITEGRNREVRKLFDAVGHAVSRLIRIRYGAVLLPRGLKRGVWIDLGEQDVRALRRVTGTDRADRGERGERPERGERADRGERKDRGPRAEGAERSDRGPRQGGQNAAAPRGGKQRGRGTGPRPSRPPEAEGGQGPMNIPNPLQQTFDKRAIQQARRPQREYGEDGPIPNPLQQTFDKRAMQQDRRPQRDYGEDGPIPNPLQQTYDKRFMQKGTGFGGSAGLGQGGGGGRGGKRRGGGGGGGGAGKGGGGGGGQPDPLKTTMGFIGGDAFLRKGGGGGGNRGGQRGGGGGGRGRR